MEREPDGLSLIKSVRCSGVPEEGVVAYNGIDFLVGSVEKYADGSISAINEVDDILQNVTHYILLSDIEKLIKNR